MRINEENPQTQNEVKTKNQTKEVIALCTRFHKENEQRAREETMERFLFSSSVLSFVIGRGSIGAKIRLPVMAFQ